MNAAAEGHMRVGVALNVKVIGAVKHLRIAVGAGNEPAHAVILADSLPVQLNVVHRDALDGTDRGIVAQAFLGGADGLPLRVGFEDGPLVGMLRKGQGAVADEVDGRFVAGRQQQHHIVDGHIPVENAVDLALRHHGNEVVVGLALLNGLYPFRHQRGDVVLQVLHGAGKGAHPVGAFAVEEAQVFRQLAQLRPVAVGNAQHPGDDQQGQRRGQVGHHVHAPFLLNGVQQLVNGGLHQGAPHLH